MYIIDVSNPLTLLLIIIVTGLLIFLSQEIKKSYINGLMLFVYLILLIMHVIQAFVLPNENEQILSILTKCIIIDFILVALTFFAYLWVDDIEAKELGKKSYDNSLDWFWKKV